MLCEIFRRAHPPARPLNLNYSTKQKALTTNCAPEQLAFVTFVAPARRMNLFDNEIAMHGMGFPMLGNLPSGMTEKLSEFINRQKVAILLEDEYCKIIFVNKAFTALFSQGAAPESLLGYCCSDAADQVRGLFHNALTFDRFIEESLVVSCYSTTAQLKLNTGQKLKAIYRRIEVSSGAQGHLWIYYPQEI